MTVQDLIDQLSELPADAEVRIASQPQWPLEYALGDAHDVDGVVYLTESAQLGYLPGDAAAAIGWA